MIIPQASNGSARIVMNSGFGLVVVAKPGRSCRLPGDRDSHQFEDCGGVTTHHHQALLDPLQQWHEEVGILSGWPLLRELAVWSSRRQLQDARLHVVDRYRRRIG